MPVKLDYSDTDYTPPGFWVGCAIAALVGVVLWDLLALVFLLVGP